MPYTPTTAELRAAYRQARLWAVGMRFEEALLAPEVFAGLVCQVIAERRHIESRTGRLPEQMNLMEDA